MTTNSQEFTRANKQDVYNHPDYYLLDELLSEEHKLIRSAVRDYVKKELSPIIEDVAQKAVFPQFMVSN